MSTWTMRGGIGMFARLVCRRESNDGVSSAVQRSQLPKRRNPEVLGSTRKRKKNRQRRSGNLRTGPCWCEVEGDRRNKTLACFRQGNGLRGRETKVRWS